LRAAWAWVTGRAEARPITLFPYPEELPAPPPAPAPKLDSNRGFGFPDITTYLSDETIDKHSDFFGGPRKKDRR
jgi:hypothetical protein